MTEILKDMVEKSISENDHSNQLHLTLFGIALATRGKNFLELGFAHGHSAIPLLLAAKYLNAHLISVDNEVRYNNVPQELRSHHTFIKDDAIRYLENNNQYFDLVFIDDWHDGLHVKKEIDLVSKFATKSTIILLHDLMYHNSQPEYNKQLGSGEFGNGGPFIAVDSLDKNQWEYATLPFTHGLTILRKK